MIIKMIKEIFESPYLLIDEVLKRESIYVIKVKCMGCLEGSFIPYEKPVIDKDILRIGGYSYPLYLIESVSFRIKWEYGKEEYKYKVSNLYLTQFLREDVRLQLEELKLL